VAVVAGEDRVGGDARQAVVTAAVWRLLQDVQPVAGGLGCGEVLVDPDASLELAEQDPRGPVAVAQVGVGRLVPERRGGVGDACLGAVGLDLRGAAAPRQPRDALGVGCAASRRAKGGEQVLGRVLLEPVEQALLAVVKLQRARFRAEDLGAVGGLPALELGLLALQALDASPERLRVLLGVGPQELELAELACETAAARQSPPGLCQQLVGDLLELVVEGVRLPLVGVAALLLVEHLE